MSFGNNKDSSSGETRDVFEAYVTRLMDEGRMDEYSVRGELEPIPNQDPNDMFRVLSLDAGGTKSYITTLLLCALEKELGMLSREIFNMIVGTESGGLLALGLAKGISAEQLAQLFEQQGEKIFASRFWFGRDASVLEEILKRNLGDGLLSEIDPEIVKVGVTSTLLFKKHGDATGVMFSNFNPQLASQITMVEAGMATSALRQVYDAQNIYVEGIGESKYIDGGVSQSNPSVMAHMEAFKFVENPNQELFMLSLGTGLKSLPPFQWSFTYFFQNIIWALKGSNYAIDSNIRAIPHYMSPSYTRDNYFWFNPQKAAKFKHDEIKLGEFRAIANQVVESKNFRDLVARLKPLARK